MLLSLKSILKHRMGVFTMFSCTYTTQDGSPVEIYIHENIHKNFFHTIGKHQPGSKTLNQSKAVLEFCRKSRLTKLSGQMSPEYPPLWNSFIPAHHVMIFKIVLITSSWHNLAFFLENAEGFFLTVNYFQTLSVPHLALVRQHVVWFVEDCHGAFGLTTGL